MHQIKSNQIKSIYSVNSTSQLGYDNKNSQNILCYTLNNKIKFSNKLTGKKSQFSLRDHLIRDLSRFDPIEESYLILRDFSQYAID